MTTRIGRLAVVLVVQLALVGAAVAGQLSARLTGTEITLRVAGVDPMDPFRGAYVALGYPDLPGYPGASQPQQTERPRGTAYVPLHRSGTVWVGREVLTRRPAGGLYLTCADSGWSLDCGIESWYLPQAKAAAMGQAITAGSALATVKVDSRGHAALVDVHVP